MDFTNIKCISKKCKDKNITMEIVGGYLGNRVGIEKVCCRNCDLILMIIPKNDEYEYGITAINKKRKMNIIEAIKKQLNNDLLFVILLPKI